MTCRSFGKSRSIKIEIDKPVLRKNGSIKYNYGSLAHSITVPNSFMQRIEAAVLVTLNNPSVKVVVKRYFDMFLRFVVLFVFIIVVIEFFGR
jgi:hypothetical protein